MKLTKFSKLGYAVRAWDDPPCKRPQGEGKVFSLYKLDVSLQGATPTSGYVTDWFYKGQRLASVAPYSYLQAKGSGVVTVNAERGISNTLEALADGILIDVEWPFAETDGAS